MTHSKRVALARAAEAVFGKADLASIAYNPAMIKRLPAGKAEGIRKPKGCGYWSGNSPVPGAAVKAPSGIANGLYQPAPAASRLIAR